MTVFSNVARGALCLSLACGGPTKNGAGVKASPTSADGAPSASASLSAAVLRDRALAAIDAGDLVAAEGALLELARRNQDSLAVRGLLDGVRSITGRNEQRAHAFANIAPLHVWPLPPPTRPGKPVPYKIEVIRTATQEEREEDYPSAIQHWDFASPVRDRADEKLPDALPFLPSRFGGSTLLVHGSAGSRWYGLYGRAERDGRFVAIVDPTGTTTRMLDFSGWRTKEEGLDAGIGDVNVGGNTVVVTARAGKQHFVAGVDLRTGKSWRAEHIGLHTAHLTIVGEHVFVAGTNFVTVLDIATGAVIARTTFDGYSPLLIPREGYLELSSGYRSAKEVVRGIRLKGALLEPHMPKPAEPATKIAPSALLPADEAERKVAYDLLDGNQMLEALLRLRPLLDRNPANVALESLFEASRAASAFARQQAGQAFAKLPRTLVAPLPKRNIASKVVAPAGKVPLQVRVVEETEAPLDRSRWWTELGVEPNRFDRDEGPGDVPVAAYPLWLPESFDDLTMGSMVRSGSGDVVATYRGGSDGTVIARFRDGKAATVLSISRESSSFGAMAADMAGDVAFIAAWDSDANGRLVAVDTASGAIRWSAPASRYTESVLCLQGHVFVSTHEPPRPAEIIVFEAETGRVVSRAGPLKNPRAYWLVPSAKGILGLSEWGRAKIALE